ncbi:glutaredoxin family protein [Staphylococcus canis]|uniref:Glutaredoxin family protein n=1 Tax=Staphylococcus canis TaxID=2724942 RepID=A0ABS0TBX1_9STAP|nr:glutaredoxin domain-containing protein [Staphylococcus canis]MBI5976040.1 glutaredoxin family protein [Staphylococcus canis]
MARVKIYTQDECPSCTFIKNYLNSHQVSFEERHISNSTFRNEMIEYDAFSTPFILIDDEPMYQVDLDKINEKLNI